MKVDLTSKELLDKEIKVYENKEKLPYKTGTIKIDGVDFKIMDANQSTIGFDEYKEQFDLFYKNFESMTRGKEYKRGDIVEINEDINTVKRATVKEIRERGHVFNCSLVIRDTRENCEEELGGHFNLSEPKNYLPIFLRTKLDIEITCSDTRYKPVKLGELLTT